MSDDDASRDRPLVEGPVDDRRHLAAAVLGGLVIALYAAWIAADLAPRWLVVPVVGLLAGYVLLGKDSRPSQAVYVCYTLALLFALTPVFVVLPDVLSAGTYGVSGLRLALVIGKLVLVVPFAILASIAAYVGFRLNGGRGVVARTGDVRS